MTCLCLSSYRYLVDNYGMNTSDCLMSDSGVTKYRVSWWPEFLLMEKCELSEAGAPIKDFVCSAPSRDWLMKPFGNWWLLFGNSSWLSPFTPPSAVSVGGSWQYEGLARVWILAVKFTCKLLQIWAWLSPGVGHYMLHYMHYMELHAQHIRNAGALWSGFIWECNAYGKVI